MKISIATDHAGLAYAGLYEELKKHLQTLGHVYIDFGPKSLDMNDDYPDYIFPAAHAVAKGECEVGIIMGGSGEGEAMAANRVKGIRCTLFYGLATAIAPIDAEGHMSDDPYEILKLSRQHNYANMLSLSGRFLTIDQMKKAIEVWLAEPWSEAERHGRRVHKLDAGA